jgi:hypothetical protein
MSNTTTIRVSRDVYDAIKSLAQQQHGKIQDVIEQAVKEYKKKKFFEDLNAGYTRLQMDPEAWAEEEAERKDWDVTIPDGLEDDNGNQ